MTKFSIFVGLIGISLAFADTPEVQITELNPTPYNENIQVDFHTNGPLENDKPLHLKVRSYPLGVSRYNEQLGRMKTNPNGSTILVLINGTYRTYVVKNENNPLIEQRTYFTKQFRKFLPRDITKNLERGQIVVTVIALNNYNESIKFGGAMETRVVNYKASLQRNPKLDEKLSKPYILYNEPYGDFEEGVPILLDFIVMNTNLGAQADKVKVYIDGNPQETLSQWVPYQITNLPPGTHSIRLVLVDENGKPYPEPFGPQQTTIVVQKKGS